MTGHQNVDLIILCGFLGSGKTSLLVDFLSQRNLNDTAVIINEAGEIGIDGALVADENSDIPLTLLSNGCVCCSLRSSLVYTVEQLLDAPRADNAGPLKRIVLETSGLSKPGPILASLADPALANRNLNVSVLSTFDVENGDGHAVSFDESAAQLAAAQRIVLTKVDRIEADVLLEHERYVRSINPVAKIIAETDRAIAVAQAFQTEHAVKAGDNWRQYLSTLERSPNRSHPRIHVLKGQAKDGIAWDDVANWLDDLAGFCGERLLRTKLIVRVSDCPDPILIQGVGTVYDTPRRLTRQNSDVDVIVVITRDVDARAIAEQLVESPIFLTEALLPQTSRKQNFGFAT